MRTRRATTRSSAVRWQAMCQQQPACRPVLALERHGVRAACRHGHSHDRARWGTWAVPARVVSLLAFGTVELRGGPGRHRCSSVIANGSAGVGRGASARVAPQRRLPTPQRPLQLSVMPPRPLPRRPRRALRFQRRHQRGCPPHRPYRGRAACKGAEALRTGGVAGRARPHEREAPTRPTQGRRGSQSLQRGWRRGSGP